MATLLGEPPSGEAVLALLSGIIDFDVLMIFQYREGEAVSIFHSLDDERRCVVIDDYMAGPFLLDPFHTHSLGLRTPAMLDMRRSSPDQFQKSEFYRRHYHLTGIADEIGIAVPIEPGVAIVVSITRRIDDPRFSRREKKLFETTKPVVSALAELLWAQERPVAEAERTKKIEHAFDEFGKGYLSPREIEIVSLILKGHSSLSIGERLGIAPGTVKIHRKNIYAKLNISSQAELFSRFITHFTES